MREKGYHDTGLNDILKHCGIPKGSFYNFFDSKETFALQVIAYYGDRLTTFIKGFVEDTAHSPVNRLRNLYTALVSIAEAEQCEKGCLVYNMSFELAGSNAAIAKALDVQFEKWVSLVAGCIREGQSAGEIITTQSAESLAEVLHTAVNGSYGRVKMKKDAQTMHTMIETMLAFIKA